MELILILGALIFLAMFGMVSLTLFTGQQLVKRRTPDTPTLPSDFGMPFEDVTFASRYKATLRGWWVPAETNKGTIILCHGQDGSMDGDLPQAVPLWQAGYNVLLFNMRAHGTSEGKKVTFGAFEKEDLLGAIDFVQQEKSVGKVAVLGFSMGAATALIAAALTDKIDLLILDGIFFKFLSTIQRAIGQYLPRPLAGLAAQIVVLGATIVTNTRMYQVSPVLWAKHLSPDIPVLFIHGENDPYATLDEIKSLASDLQGTHDVWVVPEAGHRQAFKKYPQQYNATVLEWLAKYHSS